jgi:hypothetical protein
LIVARSVLATLALGTKADGVDGVRDLYAPVQLAESSTAIFTEDGEDGSTEKGKQR